jgi:hypothetical protein
MALTEAERKAWEEIVSAADETPMLEPEKGSQFAMYDAAFFKEAAQSLLDSDGISRPPPRVRRARQIQRAIAEVLLRDWDPIGINDVPEAADEYDSYVGQIYRMLASGASADSIAQHLVSIEVSRMGLGSIDADRLLPIAEKLLSLDVRL